VDGSYPPLLGRRSLILIRNLSRHFDGSPQKASVPLETPRQSPHSLTSRCRIRKMRRPESNVPRMIDQTISHYHILQKLGGGGMGVVYRAHDERLDRDVAIKVLPPRILTDTKARERFRTEARALAKMSHPNIAHVYDFDSQNETDFLVMEYVDGITLANKLAKGALPEEELLTLGEQIGRTLAYAHEQGIVHCDLKPSNIMVTASGQVKLLDFGLARLLRASETAATESTAEAVGPAGTLAYMAPEQLRGAEPDTRSDIYAAGAVLYEMATARRPFEAKLPTALVDDILHKPPLSPQLLRTSLSPKLEDTILKCLEKDPETRYQSAKELAIDLGRLAATSSASSRIPTAKVPLRQWPVTMSVIAVCVVLALLFAVNLGGWRERWLGRATPGHIKSLVVLPLENLSHDSTQDYFSDGMTDELISDLAQIGSLRIISRTSAMHFKGTHEPLRQIARELNVDAVVEGSVLHVGERVRITAELIDVQSDKNLWANSYERDQRDILALQRDVALAIAQQVKTTLTPQERLVLTTARPVNLKAYEAYLQGRFYLSERTPEALTTGVEYFQRAIAEDPKYAIAYAGLADGYGLLASYGVRPAVETMPKAKAAALRALELDDDLAEAYTSLALIRWSFDWDLVGAEKAYRRALELAPGYATAHHWYALYLSSLGRNQEAFAEMREAQSLDPLSPIISANFAWCYYLAHDYGRAIDQARETLERYPNFSAAHEVLGQAYAENSMAGEAISELQKAILTSSDEPLTQAELAYAYAISGKHEEALAILTKLEKGSRRSPASPYAMAILHVGLGNQDEAFRWLGLSYQERDAHLVNLKVHPVFDRLRSDLRFQELQRRIGLIP
jgi:eukaryotic-like serine/threonine-protein kinase